MRCPDIGSIPIYFTKIKVVTGDEMILRNHTQEWIFILSYSKAIPYPPSVSTPLGFFFVKIFGFVIFFSYISTVILRYMITKLKNSFLVSLLIIGVVLTISALPLAIKYFFRLFLLVLENPLEAICFFGLVGGFLLLLLLFEERA